MNQRHGVLVRPVLSGYRVVVCVMMLAFSAVLSETLSAQNYFVSDTFAGRVVFEGKPVIGAEVYLVRMLYDRDQNNRQKMTVVARTDQDGRFMFNRPSEDADYTSYGLIVRKSGLSDGVARINTLIDPENIVIELFTPSPLSGVIRTSAGEPLENAVVTIYALGKTDASGRRVNIRWDDMPGFTTQSGNDGRFLFANVPSSFTLAFQASKTGYISSNMSAPAGTTDAVLTLEPGGTITGKVINGKTGMPVDSVYVTVRSQNQSRSENGTTLTGRDGRYSIEGLPSGPYRVVAIVNMKQYELCSKPLELVFVPRAGMAENVDITLQEGIVLSGRVTEKGSDQPVTRCTINVSVPTNPPPVPPDSSTDRISISNSVTVGQTYTDSDGRFTVTVSPGYVLISALKLDEYSGIVNEDTEKSLYVGAVSKPDNLHFELTREPRVHGVAYLPDGKPAAGVMISGGGLSVAITNQRGEFTLRGLRTDRIVTLPAEHRELRLEASVTVDPASTDTLKVYLHPYRYASVSGKIIDHTGVPVTGESIEVYWAEDLIGLENVHAAVSGPDGTFRVDSLRVEKNYIIGARGRQSQSPRFTASTINQPVELVLPNADRWISGRIVDVTGAPVSGVEIRIYGRPSGSHQEVTDADGSFRLGGLIGEAVSFYARKEGYGSIYFRDTPTNITRDFVLQLQDRRLYGRVVNERGEPVASAQITVAQAQYRETSYDPRTRTDSLGRFSLQELIGETVTVTIMATGYKNLKIETKTNDDNVTFVLVKE
jgi:large repetitive protein